MSKNERSNPGPDYIKIQPELPEERTKRIRNDGAELYSRITCGELIVAGPMFGGPRHGSRDGYVLSHPGELLSLAWQQLQRPEDELREDLSLIGYNPDDVAHTNPHDDIKTFLRGMGDAAKEHADPHTIRTIDKLLNLSEQARGTLSPEQQAFADEIARKIIPGSRVFIHYPGAQGLEPINPKIKQRFEA